MCQLIQEKPSWSLEAFWHINIVDMFLFTCSFTAALFLSTWAAITSAHWSTGFPSKAWMLLSPSRSLSPSSERPKSSLNIYYPPKTLLHKLQANDKMCEDFFHLRYQSPVDTNLCYIAPENIIYKYITDTWDYNIYKMIWANCCIVVVAVSRLTILKLSL